MKIEIELEVTPESLNNIDKVQDLMMALAQQLRLNEPQLYNFIHNLGYENCLNEHSGDHYCDC